MSGGMKFKARLAGGAAVAAILFGAGAGVAQAAEPVKFDIAPQPLTAALNEFGVQSNHAVLFTTDLTAAKVTRGVSKEADPEIALAEMLTGTGLSFRRSGDAFLIVSASDPQSGSAAGDGADAGTVQALIVTAQKREENIQDVPIAMSAFTQEDLTRSQVAGGPDLMTQVPNFTFTKTNFSGYSIQIRGIGTQAVSATVDPAVAVAFNNTPFIRNRFFEQEFYDLQRVEVLRGPQGTLYGRNATAGVVNIISAKPKNRYEAKLSADIANYSSSRLEGMINLPLVDGKAALRIAGTWTKRDGFVTNTLTGARTDGRDLWSTRVTLGLTPTDSFKANLVYEHFEENDDRLRSGKQLCRKDPGPSEINGVPIGQNGDPVFSGASVVYYSQGCLPASLYSPDSFQTPNGFSLGYGAAIGAVGGPVDSAVDPYLHGTQSRNLREIETHLRPEYEASTDTVELQLEFDLPGDLTLASETGFNHDRIFSFEDYNRFDTTPGVVGGEAGFCDPQLGCTNRLAAGDLSTAKSQQFSQEFRLSSNFAGPINFNIGANFLRYDTEDKYYVFINSLTGLVASYTLARGAPAVNENAGCFDQAIFGNYQHPYGYVWSDPSNAYALTDNNHCGYVDVGDIHNLNDQGRNYFLSKNPYHLLSYAAFGEGYWQVTPELKLTAGFRWTVDKKTAPQIPSWLLAADSYGTPTLKVIDQEWKEPTGRVAVDWKPVLPFTDETLVYASYVRGYKAGGANPPPYIAVFPPVCPPSCGGVMEDIVKTDSLTHPETFKPEFVSAYEVGTKNTLRDGRLTFNLNAFYYDYTGYQISQIVDRSAVNLNFDAKIWGSELEVDWRPLENLRLGFKGGYENTRLADGSSAIDLMDRTAGHTDWIVKKPFPTFPSNCIIPRDIVLTTDCLAYKLGPVAWDAPNNGEGFSKNLSGNQLPNAPKFTATITADYTLPLPNDWLVTLHTDLYYQSEAWTRVFNDPGYDKLKAYNNINVAAIFANEDAGWQVMAYVKNVLDRDSITGAFLNSDDTGLTTNVFLTEPRLYGLRVTKQWNGSAWWSAHAHTAGAHYPYRIEVSGDYGRFSGGKEVVDPTVATLFPADHPYPLGVQNDLDWGGSGGVKFIYQPEQNGWFASASVRYGRAAGDAEEHKAWEFPGGYTLSDNFKYPQLNTYFDPSGKNWFNYAVTTAKSDESHTIADFAVGKDVGLGFLSNGAASSLQLGIQYARFRSSSSAVLHGRPDSYLPSENIFKYGGHYHRFHSHMNAYREFRGAGPSVEWEANLPLTGASGEKGAFGVDIGVGGAVLWGRQKVKIGGETSERYITGDYQIPVLGKYGHQEAVTTTSLNHSRTSSATVPSVSASLGLSYTLDGLKVSGGYRIERYFDAIDGGIAERKTYDRQYDGPYFKVSVGFGG